VSALFCALLFFAVSFASAQDFYFVQITDTHLWDADHGKRLEKIIKLVNTLPMKIEFTAVTGDVFQNCAADKEKAEKGAELFKKLKEPVFFTPGNHDILKKDTDKCLESWRSVFGRLSFSVENHGVVFVFVSTEDFSEMRAVPDYNSLSELKKHLAEAGGKPVVVFHHVPAVEKDFYNNKFGVSWKDEGARREWVSIISANKNVKAVITGHFHRDELDWFGDTPVFTAPSVAGYWGRQASFRVYHYKGGKIGYRSVYLDMDAKDPK
jgi:3',5'-cyclic AMP phosphodiesterase CpdA